MTDSSPKESSPVLDLDGKKYDINSLTEEAKKLIEGVNIANAQLRMQEDALKLMVLGRSSLIKNLRNNLKDVKPLDEKK